MAGVPKWIIYARILLSISVIILFTSPGAFGEPIKIGVLLPLSGRLSELGGEMERKSYVMAAGEINGSGGIGGGRRLHFIIEDTAGKVSTGRAAAEKLISQDHVSLLCGGFSSTVTWVTSVLAQERKVPFLVNTASADRISEGRREWIFRLCTPVSEHPLALSSFIGGTADIQRVLVLYEETPLGQYLSDKFSKQCKELGLQLLEVTGYDPAATDFRTYLMEIKEQSPDMLYIIAKEETAALILRQVQEWDLNPKLILGNAAGFTSNRFRERAGDAAEYVYSHVLWSPLLPYPGAVVYYTRFIERYGIRPDYHGAQAYAAAQVIADALRRAASMSRDDVRAALAATQQKMTVLGPVTFRSYGTKRQQNRLATYLVQWINGRLEIVWPMQAATQSYVYPVPPWNQR